jgi:hypothetical protein
VGLAAIEPAAKIFNGVAGAMFAALGIHDAPCLMPGCREWTLCQFDLVFLGGLRPYIDLYSREVLSDAGA